MPNFSLNNAPVDGLAPLVMKDTGLYVCFWVQCVVFSV